MNKIVIFIIIMIVAVNTARGETKKEKPVLLGMTTALTGPTSFLGQQMRAGVEIYLHRINREGGVKGRKIKLITLDDGYRKDIAKMNMEYLIDRNVLAFIGNVGTPTATVTLPIAQEHKCLFFGAYTGSTILRNEFPGEDQLEDSFEYVANYRASYYDELERIVTELFNKGIRPTEIGLFAQKGEWGDELTAHVVRIFKNNGYSSIPPVVGLYKRNTTDIKDAVFKLIEGGRQLRAIILAGPYSPSAKCLKTLKPVLPDALFLGISFMGGESFIRELKGEAEGVIVTQVVPSLMSDVPIVKKFKNDLKLYVKSDGYKECYGLKSDSKYFLTHVALEGYIVAKLFVKVLDNTENLDESQSIIAAMHKFKGKSLDIGIFNSKREGSKFKHTLKWNESKRQFSNYVWAAIVQDGRLIEFNWDH